MAQWTADAAVAASVLLAGISLSLGILGAIAWRRLRAPRLGFVACAFFAFALEGVVLAWNAYDQRTAIADGTVANALVIPGLGLLIVALLYAAVLKR